MFPSLDASRVFSTIDTEFPKPYNGGGALAGSVTSTAAGTTLGDGSAMPPDQFTVRCRIFQTAPAPSARTCSTLHTAAAGMRGAFACADDLLAFQVGELLELAGTSYATVQATGCVLSVSLLWDCFVDGGNCFPTVSVQRLDLSAKRNGFEYQYANYYRMTDTGPQQRDLYTVKV